MFVKTKRGFKYVCDHEIGKPGSWHGCGKKAIAGIETGGGCRLHYCKDHLKHKDDPKSCKQPTRVVWENLPKGVDPEAPLFSQAKKKRSSKH